MAWLKSDHPVVVASGLSNNVLGTILGLVAVFGLIATALGWKVVDNRSKAESPTSGAVASAAPEPTLAHPRDQRMSDAPITSPATPFVIVSGKWAIVGESCAFATHIYQSGDALRVIGSDGSEPANYAVRTITSDVLIADRGDAVVMFRRSGSELIYEQQDQRTTFRKC